MKKRHAISLDSPTALPLLLLALYLALPYLVRDYLNGKLVDMDDYRGHIADVGLALWRGAHRINGLSIVKNSGKVPVPFLDAPSIDLLVSWQAFWDDHAVVARVVFERPQLSFVGTDGDRDVSQIGASTNWRERPDKLLPTTLNEVWVVDNTLRFRNLTSKPPVSLYALTLSASIYNLTNVVNARGEWPARFEDTVWILGQAPLEMTAHFNPLSDFEDSDLRLRVAQIKLEWLNDFISAYGKFDFNAGTDDPVLEAQARRGQLGGYIEPLLRNVDVSNWRQDVEDGDKNLFHSMWEALIGGGGTVLKNQRKDQSATRVSLSGNVHQRDIGASQVFPGILRDAFVETFNVRFERSSATRDDDN